MEGKINRIRRENKVLMDVLEDTLGEGGDLHLVAPNVAKEEEILKVQGEMERTASVLGKYARTGGFDPTRTFLHVAHIPNHAVWEVVLKTFARYDEFGHQIDDGLLYKTDPRSGQLVLNRDFFYALIGPNGPLRRYSLQRELRAV